MSDSNDITVVSLVGLIRGFLWLYDQRALELFFFRNGRDPSQTGPVKVVDPVKYNDAIVCLSKSLTSTQGQASRDSLKIDTRSLSSESAKEVYIS